jgi:hypothetical protein
MQPRSLVICKPLVSCSAVCQGPELSEGSSARCRRSRRGGRYGRRVVTQGVELGRARQPGESLTRTRVPCQPWWPVRGGLCAVSVSSIHVKHLPGQDNLEATCTAGSDCRYIKAARRAAGPASAPGLCLGRPARGARPGHCARLARSAPLTCPAAPGHTFRFPRSREGGQLPGAARTPQTCPSGRSAPARSASSWQRRSICATGCDLKPSAYFTKFEKRIILSLNTPNMPAIYRILRYCSSSPRGSVIFNTLIQDCAPGCNLCLNVLVVPKLEYLARLDQTCADQVHQRHR